MISLTKEQLDAAALTNVDVQGEGVLITAPNGTEVYLTYAVLDQIALAREAWLTLDAPVPPAETYHDHPGADMAVGIVREQMIQAEIAEYFDGAYGAAAGSLAVRDQLTRFFDAAFEYGQKNARGIEVGEAMIKDNQGWSRFTALNQLFDGEYKLYADRVLK